MNKNVVHTYFKKETAAEKKIVQINPIEFTGVEITIFLSGEIEAEEMEPGEDIVERTMALGYKESSPLEFNLYYSGTITGKYKPEENS